ncbi:helix-turn-helix transcriptional regulator [Clostridium perfringens]|nr:helix-turn-helix transcriptional regulator [Clostridium perfringens]MDK0664276.1 helix-turn-helix transcriptional regulator [Clostridium perfringens]
MLTYFGKFARKLRIDNGELLKDMAEKLEVTTSYLSAVEVGKRNIPTKWKEKLVNIYNLDENKEHELDEAIFNSQKVIKLNLENLRKDSDKELMLAFARKFEDLDDDSKKDIINILNK